MPSIRYYNSTAPFWDFVADLEEQGSSHPFFVNRGGDGSNEQRPPNPWEGGWGFPWGGPHAFRGRHAPPPPPTGAAPATSDNEKSNDPEEGPSDPRGPPPPFSEEPGKEPQPPRAPDHPRRGCHGGRGRGGWHGRGGWGGPHGRGPAACGQRGFAGPMGGFGALADMFQSQIFGDNNNTNTDTNRDAESFKPDVDVFDTAEAYVVHLSLPGAKKEDVGVNWDADKSELAIAGVVYRPGDEELLQTLALDERKVGVFERKIRLGSRANPAQVDVDGITAKMEDGVLRINVPKQDAEYVEIRKVDVE